MLISTKRLMVTPSLMFSFAANFHLNYPRQLPSSLVAQLVEQRLSFLKVVGSNLTWVRVFRIPVLAHFLSRFVAQKVSFGIIIQRFNLNHLRLY